MDGWSGRSTIPDCPPTGMKHVPSTTTGEVARWEMTASILQTRTQVGRG